MEETGYGAKTWKHMGSFTVDGTRGICKTHMFLATGLRKNGSIRPDDMEQCEIVFLTRREIREAFRDREIILLPDIAILSMATSDLFSDFFDECRT
jgi:hypothetical protein